MPHGFSDLSTMHDGVQRGDAAGRGCDRNQPCGRLLAGTFRVRIGGSHDGLGLFVLQGRGLPYFVRNCAASVAAADDFTKSATFSSPSARNHPAIAHSARFSLRRNLRAGRGPQGALLADIAGAPARLGALP